MSAMGILDAAAAGLARAYQGAIRVLEYLIGAGILLMFAIVLLNAVLRYGFDSGIPESEEIALLALVWVTLLGSAVVLARDGHLGMGVTDRLHPFVLALVRLAGALAMLGLLFLLFDGSVAQVGVNQINTLPSTGLRASWLYYPGVIGALLMGVVMAGRVIGLVRTLWRLASQGDDDSRPRRAPHAVVQDLPLI